MLKEVEQNKFFINNAVHVFLLKALKSQIYFAQKPNLNLGYCSRDTSNHLELDLVISHCIKCFVYLVFQMNYFVLMDENIY